MTDQELLELAAKAACLSFVKDGAGNLRDATGANPYINLYSLPIWNPLTDDGDALRLAVKLKLEVAIWFDRTDVDSDEVDLSEPHENDPYAATRRAIVRAAAEIGKTK